MEGSEASAGRLDRGKHAEHIEVPTSMSHVTRSDSFGDRCGWRICRSEEPDALMRARTGLWEPWVGNDPGPPGPKALGKPLPVRPS